MRIHTIVASVILATTAAAPLVQAAVQLPFFSKWTETPVTPRWNDLACQPTAEHPNPLVLVHGLYSQGERHWKEFAPKFAEKGYCVFTPTYGSLHGQSLINGLDAIENSAEQLDRFAAVGGNFYGTTYLGLSTFLQKLGLYDLTHQMLRVFCPACFDLVEGSDFYKNLYAHTNGRDTVPDVLYYNLVSRYDEYVVESGFMKDKNPNVRNVYLQDLCPSDHAKHFDITKDPVVFNAVNAHFDKTAPQDIGCGPYL
ncbi:hypothetical protein BGZ73_008435 [Actinomortierella ambigua]|nr:hypothetical protein BGZ73_008435 [Actinomortierella ambigua]